MEFLIQTFKSFWFYKINQMYLYVSHWSICLLWDDRQTVLGWLADLLGWQICPKFFLIFHHFSYIFTLLFKCTGHFSFLFGLLLLWSYITVLYLGMILNLLMCIIDFFLSSLFYFSHHWFDSLIFDSSLIIDFFPYCTSFDL